MDSAFGQALNWAKNTLGGIGQDIGNLFGGNQPQAPQPPSFSQADQSQIVQQQSQNNDFMSNLVNDWNNFSNKARQTVQKNVQFTPVPSSLGVGIGPFSLKGSQPALPDIQVPKAVQDVPVLGFGADFGAGLLNVVPHYTQGNQELNQAANDIAQGKSVTPQQIIGSVAKTAELPLTLMGGEGLGEGLFQGARPILQRLGQGALTGAQYGGTFAGLGGLEQGQKAPDVASQIGMGLSAVPQGMAFGAALGLGTAGLGAGFAKLRGVDDITAGLSPEDAQKANNTIPQIEGSMSDRVAQATPKQVSDIEQFPRVGIKLPNGLNLTPDAMKYLQEIAPQVEQSKEIYSRPDALSFALSRFKSFDKDFEPSFDLNHTPADKQDMLQGARGEIAMVKTQDISAPSQKTLDTTLMHLHAINQLVTNNGITDLPVLRRIYGQDGNISYDTIDGHHRGILGTALGLPQIPAVVIDNKLPTTIRDSFNQIKGIVPSEQGISTKLPQVATEGTQVATPNIGADMKPLNGEDYSTWVKRIGDQTNYSLYRNPVADEWRNTYINPLQEQARQKNITFSSNPIQLEYNLDSALGNKYKQVQLDNMSVAQKSTELLGKDWADKYSEMLKNPLRDYVQKYYQSNVGQQPPVPPTTQAGVFYRTINNNGQIVKEIAPNARAVSISPEISSYYYKDGKNFIVNENSTGLKIGDGATLKEAIANSQSNITKAEASGHNIQDIIKGQIAKHQEILNNQKGIVPSEQGISTKLPQVATEGTQVATPNIGTNLTPLGAGLSDTLYRGEGGTNKFQGKAGFFEGTHYATNADRAATFGTVSEHQLSPDANVLKINAVDKNLGEVNKQLGLPEDSLMSSSQIRQHLVNKGYDAVEFTDRISPNNQVSANNPIHTDIIDLTGNAVSPRVAQQPSTSPTTQAGGISTTQPTTDDYHWYNSQTKKYEVVPSAKPVDVTPGVDTFISRNPAYPNSSGWVISEAKSGTRVSEGATQKEAIAIAQQRFGDLKDVTPQQLIDRMIQDHGTSPRYSQPLTGKVAPEKVSAKLAQANQDLPQAAGVAQNAANQVGGVIQAKIKTPQSLVEKVATDKGRTLQNNPDTLQTTVIAPNRDLAYKAADLAKETPGVEVIKDKRDVKNPETGYNAPAHLQLKLPDNQRMELQAQTPESVALREQGHAKYKGEAGGQTEAQTGQVNARVGQESEPLPWEDKKAVFDKLNLSADPVIGAKDTPPQGGYVPPGDRVGEGLGTPGRASVDPAEVARQARLAHFAANQNIAQDANVTAQLANRALKTPEDNMNFRFAMEDPSKLNEYAQKSSNPQAFKDFAKTYSDFTDRVLAQAKGQKVDINTVEDYYTHIWDLSKPGAQQIFDDLMAKNAKNFQSGFTKERLYATLHDGLDAGLTLKNPKVSQDIMEYSNSMGRQLGSSALNNKINELRPGGAVPLAEQGTIPYNFEGRLFQQSNVPGNAGTFIDPEIHDKMGFYNRSAFADNPIVRKMDQVNTFVKWWDLALGGFHGFKTTIRQAVNDPRIIPTAVRNAVDPGARLNFRQQAINDGTIDFGSKIGVTFGKSGDLLKQDASVAEQINSKNPLTAFTQGLFGGLIDTYKINLTRGIMSKFDLADEAQAREAQRYGAQINNLMGGLNYEEFNRNHTIQQLARGFVLAPDFNEGKLKQVATALNLKDWSPSAVFARKNVLGEALVLATISEIGRKITTGNFSPDVKSFITNSVLSPQIPLPNTAMFNNPKTGRTQTAELPGSDIGDVYRGVTDPGHFLQARVAAVPAKVASLVSGTDYYGRPLVDPFGTAQDNPLNRVKALLPNTLPIPGVQAIKVAQGKETPIDSFLNTIGFRVINNPNDPKAVAQKQYFDGLNQTAQNLNPNDQKVFFGTLHPITKDTNGNSVIDKNYYTTPDKYETLISNPKLFEAEREFQLSQSSHDPLWDLTPDQQRAYMQAEVIAKNDPTGGFSTGDKTKSALYASLPQDFWTKRSAYFDSLVKQGVMKQPSSFMTQTPPEVQNFWNAYAKLPYGTGVRQQAMATPMGQLALQFLNQEKAMTNQQRLAMGLPLLSASGGSSGGSGGGGSSSQSSLDNYMLRRSMAMGVANYYPIQLQPAIHAGANRLRGFTQSLLQGQGGGQGGQQGVGMKMAMPKGLTAKTWLGTSGGNVLPKLNQQAIRFKKPQLASNIHQLGGQA